MSGKGVKLNGKATMSVAFILARGSKPHATTDEKPHLWGSRE